MDNLVLKAKSGFKFCLDHSLALELVELGDHIIHHLNWNTFKSELSRDNRCKPHCCSPFFIHTKEQQLPKVDFVGGRSCSGLV